MTEYSNLKKQTRSMMLATFASRVFGLVRVQVITFLLGTSRSADIWGIAFMVPNLFRRLIAEGAMSSAFVPLLSNMNRKSDRKKFAAHIFSMMFLVATVFTILMIIWLPDLLPALLKLARRTPDGTDASLAIQPTQLMFPFLIFVCLSAVCQSILNVEGVFFYPAMTPILISLGVITGGMTAYFLDLNLVFGLGTGVLAGGFMQLIMQWFVLKRSGYTLFPWHFRWSTEVRQAVILWLPTTFSAGVYQINLLLSRSVSFSLFDGAIAALNYSARLTELVLGIFAASISTALLPALSRKVIKDNPQESNKYLFGSLTDMSFIAIPASVGLALAGFPLVGFLFKYGAFSEWSHMLTYGALLFGSLTLVPISWYRILSQLFYAQRRVKSLVVISILATCLNVIGFFVLPGFFPQTISHLGIGLSTLIYSWILYFSVSIYASITMGFEWKSGPGIQILKMVLATACILPVWFPFNLAMLGFFTWALKVACSIIIYLTASHLLSIKAMENLLGRWRR